MQLASTHTSSGSGGEANTSKPRPGFLTLREVLDAVRARHPKVSAATARANAAEAKALAGRGAFDPRLSVRGRWMPLGYYRNGQLDVALRQPTRLWGVDLEAGYRLGLGTYAVYEGDLQTLSGGEVRAGLSVPVWRDGPIDGRRPRRARTAHEATGARFKLRAETLRLAGRATDAYWKWVAAGLRVRIARRLLALARERDRGLRVQAEAGAIPAIRVLDNRRQILEREAGLVSAERAFQQASLALSLYYRDERARPGPWPRPSDAASRRAPATSWW